MNTTTFQFINACSQYLPNATVTVQPVQYPVISGSAIVVGAAIDTTTNFTGTATFLNLVPNYYQVSFKVLRDTTTFYVNIPSGSGSVSGGDYTVSCSINNGDPTSVYFNIIDCTGHYWAVKQVSLTPLFIPNINDGNISTRDVITLTTDLNGAVTFPSVIPGTYLVTATGTRKTTKFYINVPAYSGSVNAKDILTLPTNQMLGIVNIPNQAIGAGLTKDEADRWYQTIITSGSFFDITVSDALTASFALNSALNVESGSTYPITSSWATTASFSINTLSSSYALTSSYALNSNGGESASWASSSLTSLSSQTSDFSLYSNFATSASYAISSSLASNWDSSSIVTLIGTKQNTIVTGSTLSITSSITVNANNVFVGVDSSADVSPMVFSVYDTTYPGYTSLNKYSASYKPSTNTIIATTFQGTASVAITASYALNGGTGGASLVTGSTYPITSSWSSNWDSSSIVSLIGTKQNAIATGSTLPVTASYLNGSGIISSSLDFQLTTDPVAKEGRVYYDNDSKCLAVMGANGTAIQVGQENVIRVHNKTGVQIDNGKLVSAAGTATGFRPDVKLAICNGDNELSLMGMATENIAHGSDGYITSFGLVHDVNTNGLGEGTSLFLSSTSSGSYSTVHPVYPHAVFRIGTVLKDHLTQGIIAISIEAHSADWATTASLALTSSYAPVEPAYSSSVVIQLGNKQNTIATGSTLPITASWSNNAITASYAVTTSFYSYTNIQQLFVTNSLIAISASWASRSLSSSYSPVEPDYSSSMVTLLGAKQNTLVTGNTYPITASVSVNAIQADNATTADNAAQAVLVMVGVDSTSDKIPVLLGQYDTGGLYPGYIAAKKATVTYQPSTDTLFTTASRALTASYALNAGSGGTTLVTGSTYPITASWATNALTASYVTASNIVGNITAYSSSYASRSLSASYAPVEPAYSASVSTQFGTKQNTIVTGSTLPITSSITVNANNVFVGVDSSADVSPLVFSVYDVSYPNYTSLNKYSASYQPSTNTVTATNFAGTASVATKAVTSSFATNTYYGILTKEPTGFPNRTDTTLSYESSSAKLMISGSNWKVYCNGNEFIKNNESIVISSPTKGQLYYISYSPTGVLQQSVTEWSFQVGAAPVCTVYLGNGSGNGFISDERHGIIMDSATHEYIHDTIGPRYASGFTWTTTTASLGKYTLSAGEWYDDDLASEITYVQSSSLHAYYSQSMVVSTTETGSIYNGGIEKYNNPTLGTLVDLTGGQAGAMFVYAINGNSNKLLSVYGQRVDTTVANARTNNTPETLVFGNFPFREAKLLYRVIITTAGIVETTDYRTAQYAGSTFTPTSHGSLTGLTNDDHQQYLLLAGRDGQTAATFTGSIVGSSSYATSASYWDSSSIATVLNNKQWNIATGSLLPVTASWSNNSLTASYVTASNIYGSVTAYSASYASRSLSASYAPVEPAYSASVSTQFGTKQNTIVTGSTLPITASITVNSNNIFVGVDPSADVSPLVFSVYDVTYPNYTSLNKYSASYQPSTNTIIATTFKGTASTANSSSVAVTSLQSNAINVGVNNSVSILPVMLGVQDDGGVYPGYVGLNKCSMSYQPSTDTLNVTTLKGTASVAISASYASNGGTGGTTLVTGSTYPITASWSVNAKTASYQERGADWTFWANINNIYTVRNADNTLVSSSNDLAGLFQWAESSTAKTNAVYYQFGNVVSNEASPLAHYFFSRSVVLTKSCVIRGTGNPTTVFTPYSSSFAGPLIQFGTPATLISGIGRLEDIRFQAWPGGLNQYAVWYCKCSEPSMFHCETNDFTVAGVRVTSSGSLQWAYFNENFFVPSSATTCAGLIFDGPNTAPYECNIANNFFSSNGGTPLVFTGSNTVNGIRINNNRFWQDIGNTKPAIDIGTGNNYLIEDNAFEKYASIAPITFRDRATATYCNTLVAGNMNTDGILWVSSGSNCLGIKVTGNMDSSSLVAYSGDGSGLTGVISASYALNGGGSSTITAPIVLGHAYNYYTAGSNVGDILLAFNDTTVGDSASAFIGIGSGEPLGDYSKAELWADKGVNNTAGLFLTNLTSSTTITDHSFGIGVGASRLDFDTVNGINVNNGASTIDMSGNAVFAFSVTAPALNGTASWALEAVSASYAPGAGVSSGGSYNISTSFASSSISSSYALSASYAPGGTAATYTSSLYGTASWATKAVQATYASASLSASWASSSISASYALTASYAMNAVGAYMASTNPTFNGTLTEGTGGLFTVDSLGNIVTSGKITATGSIISTGGFVGTASWASNTVTASYVTPYINYVTVATTSLNAITVSFASPSQIVNLTTAKAYSFSSASVSATGQTSDVLLVISHSAASTSSFTFPSNWQNIGTGWPTGINANTVATLWLRSIDSDHIVGSYNVSGSFVSSSYALTSSYANNGSFAKATWVMLGSTLSVINSTNGTLTRIGAGNYGFTFATPATANDYCVNLNGWTASVVNTKPTGSVGFASNQQTTGFSMSFNPANSVTLSDVKSGSMVVFTF